MGDQHATPSTLTHEPPGALSPKMRSRSMGYQIYHMTQLVHVFAAIYFVHIGTFQISFGAIFYTLGRLLKSWSVLRMCPPLRSGGED